MTAVATGIAEQATPVSRHLSVLRDLFTRLEAAEIRYCHWKSNEHLEASLTGATDVDILVDRSAAQRLARLLTDDTRFKRFVVRAGRGYPGIEDYVGFDRETGRLTHLHVHYQLTLGEKFLKGHRLPWEESVLATRVLDAEHGCYVTDPHLELLILVVRHTMKLRWRDYGRALLGLRYFSRSMLRELHWLAARVEPARLVAVAAPLVGPAAAHLLPQMTGPAGPSVSQLRAFRRLAEPPLAAYRMYSGPAATSRMWSRELTWIWWRVTNLLRRSPARSTRTPPQGGLLITFVGVDGPGRSTLTETVARWLSREVAVVTAHSGSGRARERRQWGTVVRRARSLGAIVLSDDLPLGQITDVSDPREAASLRWVEIVPPDVVVRLRVPPDIPLRAKTDGRDQRRSEVESVAELRFPPTTRLLDVDANQPLDRVLLQVQQGIWECL